MRKSKASTGLISCFLILSILVICYNSELGEASGQDIYVDITQRYPDEADGSVLNPYKNIQDAIDGAQNGDTIKILPGNYNEELVIDKSITLTTDKKENINISSGQPNTYLIDITAPSVSLEDLTIHDLTTTSHRKAVIHIASGANGVAIIDNLINRSMNGYGILIDGSDSAVIRNNSIESTNGIFADNSDLLTIDNNYVANCTNYPALRLVSSSGNQIGENIFRGSTYGIYSDGGSDNLVYNNTIYGNTDSGAEMKGGTNNNFENNFIYDNNKAGLSLSSSNGIIYSNSVYDNEVCISLSGFNYEVRDNSIYSASFVGVYCRPGSYNNIIFNNSFTSKMSLHAKDEGDNQWDKDYLGNYWDDFYGPDPYNENNTINYDINNIPDVYKYLKGGVTDNYPKGIYQKQPWISTPSPANLAEGVDRSPRISVIVTDPDPFPYTERLDVYFYYILGDTPYLISVDCNVESGGTASVWFSSTVEGKNAVYSYGGLGYDYIGQWYVEVEDSYTKITSSIWIFSTLNTPVDNEKPNIDIAIPAKYMVGNEIHARINDSISFDASGSNDVDGEIIFYKWSFDPETSVTNEVTHSHSFKSKGTYEVNLVIIDDDGSSNISSITAVIEDDENRAPSANISAPAEGYVGNSISFSGAGSYDPDSEDTITYYWEFGDGETSTEQNLTHQYSTAGRYIVILRVTDGEGQQSMVTKGILIKSKKSEGIPGFEMVFLIIAISLIFTFLKKKKIYF